MKTVQVELKKKTILDAYNVVSVQRDLGFPAYQKGEPLHDLLMEIKRAIKRNKKQPKWGSYPNIWKELLDFWPMTIVVPAMLIAILLGAAGVF